MRSELFSVIDLESADIVCITGTLPKNHRGRIIPVKLKLQGYDCFHNMGHFQCRRGVAMRVKKRTSLLGNESSVDAIYPDFSKSFNSVPHERVKVKLRAH